MQRLLTIVCLFGLWITQTLAAAPKIAVPDFAFENQIQDYFRIEQAEKKSRLDQRRERLQAQEDARYLAVEGTVTRVERGELHKFVADVRGSLLKTGRYRVMQAKNTSTKENEKLQDIIYRIKQGHFQGADYVLFGSISSLEMREEINPVINTNSFSKSLSLDIVVEFNLVNTKTHEIKAAFSAQGNGQDSRLISHAEARVLPARGRVIEEAGKSLADAVLKQLDEQFSRLAPENVPQNIRDESDTSSGVVIFR